MKDFLYRRIVWIKPSIIFGVWAMSLFIFILCGITNFHNCWQTDVEFPRFNDCREAAGYVKQCHLYKGKGMNYIEIEMDSEEKYIISAELASNWNWEKAVKEMKTGAYVELEVLSPINTPVNKYPRVISLSCDGKEYLSLEEGKEIFQKDQINIGGRETLIWIFSFNVMMLIFGGIMINQVMIVKRLGKKHLW